MQLRLNGSSRSPRYDLPHATVQPHPRPPHPPPSRRQPLAAQPAAGAGKDPRAGQAGRTVAPPRPVAPAASHAFAVGGGARRPWQNPAPGNSYRTIEPFACCPDLFLPGTLHHSGNRPAPPSEHTPLERRSAFVEVAIPEQGPRRSGGRNTIRPAEKRIIEQMEPFGSAPVMAEPCFRARSAQITTPICALC